MARKAKTETLPAKPAASSAQISERCRSGAEPAPVPAASAECGRSPADVIRSLEAQLEQARRECKELEQSYTKNREIYSLAIEATNLGIYDTKVKDEDLALKENWLARLGYDPKLARDSQLTWERLIHPDDFERATTLF
ncbi:MAG TPA: hypothetical protein VFF68_02550, partial [Anaerolineaceae bacterium]|nr:hypothetical protein [Anaerolineaceae bacterium]